MVRVMAEPHPEVNCLERDPGVLEVDLSGTFRMTDGNVPMCEDGAVGGVRKIIFRDRGIQSWDTVLLAVLLRILRGREGAQVDLTELPEGVRTLHRLATREVGRKDVSVAPSTLGFPTRVGIRVLSLVEGVRDFVGFTGAWVVSVGRLIRGRARFRREDVWEQVRRCGPDALGIVTLVSLLVGAILAFVGAVQLRMFGAEIFVADLVGLGMVMEMGALMTGVILAGRSGAAFAAQLGTMRVNEEVDALQTMGIPPSDYLVMPRMVALSCMTPLLVMYANAAGIVGGSLVGVFLLEVPPRVYFDQTFSLMTPWHVWQGVIKGTSFGIWVALAGCFLGMRSGRSASAVGRAATSAVVSGIVGIVVIDAMWTWLFMVME